jgi:hypothetical protein
MASLDFAFGSLNVHRLDCDRDHHHPCDSWTERSPKVAKFIHDEMKCSVYAFQECLPQQAVDITDYLGWGDATNPAYVWDENQNCLAYDRAKWTDVGVLQVSLGTVDSKADQHRRSVVWVLLHHLSTGKRFWAGSAHLENGDAEERILEAQRLVDVLPPTYPLALGIDRNSYTTDEDGPRAIFEDAGLEELVPDNDREERSFNAWDYDDVPYDGKSIDGQHYRGIIVRNGRMEYTTNLELTDHNALVGNLTLP